MSGTARERPPADRRACERCGEPITSGGSKYCSKPCAARRERPGGEALWSKLHKAARKLRGPKCEACGAKKDLHAHHVDGDPTNNDPANIQTLCGACHHFVHAAAALVVHEDRMQLMDEALRQRPLIPNAIHHERDCGFLVSQDIDQVGWFEVGARMRYQILRKAMCH
jgi:hypothetical protein